MNVLYNSVACSLHTLEKLSTKLHYPLTSVTVQKFHRLILEGLIHNGVNVETISLLPQTGFLDKAHIEEVDGIKYKYMTVINIPIIRQICMIFSTFFSTINWHFKQNNQHVVFCDMLILYNCIGVVLAKIFGVKIVGILTDMPGMMQGQSTTFINKQVRKLHYFLLKQFDGYVFLTQAMNDVVNKKDKPYIIMEGLVDSNVIFGQNKIKDKIRKVVYAGGLYEKYGVKMLIDAFRKVEGDDLRLNIYGNGPMKSDMKKFEELDERFSYQGICSNSEILKIENEATLLVNPRPSTEEFTKYSFPSKNMEYMVSGTPVLTMALPGMPKNYYDKVFVCYDESVDGLANKLDEILKMSNSDLEIMGRKGKEFVLLEKNNLIQGKRILELFKSICL